MLSLIVIIGLTVAITIYGAIEYRLHQKYLSAIPIRIHINGTRGKSSVTRLIGAGLRAGGLKTITKVTGTFPRIILPDGSEAVVHRKEKANILEQLDIIKYCSQQKAEVLIIECMALQPIYQKITEHQMVKANIGVITNIRLDHLDVMGPTLDDVAKAICRTIPKKSQLFTSENRYLGYMNKVAKRRKTTIRKSEAASISKTDMQGFTYIEHKDNVALALDICSELGVERASALKEMKRSIPDEGVLRRYTINAEDKRIFFYNALAANDPESTLMIWKSIKEQCDPDEHIMIVLNTRKDRQDRAVQLVKMIALLDYGSVGLIGESLDNVFQMCIKKGVPKEKIHAIGEKSTHDQFIDICHASHCKTTVLAIGNMGVGGAELAQYFEKKHKQN
ncbi:poly-gamma-glutamate synthase PgsB [Seonamhaeicola sp.]|uniref:poly-gamma-glutamate synthase PgsB n=1 Tax=Seonamhaeicola sp. TaxID=1912245 RepID=UPI0026171685|nr:poly-gamma-glutamate synthase PgsB [Seonamhaeicola sp.]